MNLDQYERRVRQGPCFICSMLAGDPEYRHHVVYEDDSTIAFLNKHPTLRGCTLVAPRRHVESWVRDMTEAEFLALQRVAREVAVALDAVLPVERMYALSLGSQQGNSHLHWHIAPLPPGVPYEHQQYRALMAEHGVLDVSDDEQAALASEIRSALPRMR
ncbi:MAG: HIT family protein [Actinobacteria bacterium]|nr:HIT family protein [Actinomycetota bacterium]